MRTFLTDKDINLDEIINSSTEDLLKLELLDEASEILLNPAHSEEFAGFVRQINRIFKAILPDARVHEFVKERVALNVIYRQMRVKSGADVDDQDVLDVVRKQVNELLDESIVTIRIDSNLPEPINIAGIDFEALGEIIRKIRKPKRSEIERLKRIIERRLLEMLERNSERKDLQEKFQELVNEYNLGAYTAEKFFEELKNFVDTLDEEEKRGAREDLTEEELAIFDLLCKRIELSEKQRTKARVHNLIEEVLDQLPEEEYSDEIWPKKCEEIYLHIFDKYAGEGVSVYQ